MSAPENLLVLILVSLLGLVCGSFVTALSYRLPRGKDFVLGRSQCPECMNQLLARDLVPVLSWLISRGKCRQCGVGILNRYPAIEILCSVLFVTVALAADPWSLIRIILLWGLVVGLLALSVIELEFRLLPNRLILFLFVFCGVLAWMDKRAAGDVTIGLAATLVAGIFLRVFGQIINKKPGLRWDDIKLATAVSIAIPIAKVATFLAFGGGLVLILAVWHDVMRKQRCFPFGTAICGGAFAALL